MAYIAVEDFSGEKPRSDPHLLGTESAQTAKDCNLFSGELRPIYGNVTQSDTLKAGTISSIYRFAADTATPFWFSWTSTEAPSGVDVVKAPISNSTERTIFTGVGNPQITDNSLALTGGTLYPVASWDLGIPAPTSALAASATANSDSALNEEVAYVYTYVSGWGEEGPPSPASTPITMDTTAISVALSSMDTVPTGNYNITNKRIYRTLTGTSTTSYQFVAEIPVANTTYTDTTADSALGEVISTETYDMPPTDLKGIVAMPNGILAGISGNQVCFSEPYQPHAWPVSYRFAMVFTPVGLGVSGNTLYCLTTAKPTVFTVPTPASASSYQLQIRQSCVSKDGIVDVGSNIAFPSPDGIVIIGNTYELITDKIITRKEWQALNPSSIKAFFLDGRYIATYDATSIGGTTGSFILDTRNPQLGFIFLSNHYTAGFTDLVTDELFLIDSNGNLVKWDADTSALTYTWKSKKFRMQEPMNMAVCKVHADSYPLTCEVYADGVLKHTETVSSIDPFRLPSGYLAGEWEFQLSGTSTVYGVELATTMREMRSI